MGKYLCFGIATKIVITVNPKYIGESNEESLERIGKKVDLNLYSRTDNENSIVLDIKKDIFEEYAIKFILEQNCRIDEEDHLYSLYKTKELLICLDMEYEKKINLSKNGMINSMFFISEKEWNTDISYIDELGRCNISCDLLCYLCDGKIYLNNGEKAFNYIRECVKKSSGNCVRNAFVIATVEKKR